MLHVTFELEFRVAFPLPRLTRVELFKKCSKFNETNDNTIKMTFELRSTGDEAVFEDAADVVRWVRKTVADCGDERAGFYPLTVVRMLVRARRGR